MITRTMWKRAACVRIASPVTLREAERLAAFARDESDRVTDDLILVNAIRARAYSPNVREIIVQAVSTIADRAADRGRQMGIVVNPSNDIGGMLLELAQGVWAPRVADGSLIVSCAPHGTPPPIETVFPSYDPSHAGFAWLRECYTMHNAMPGI